MIRNLKVLGLALVAMFAMSAVIASAASAQTTDGKLTSTGPVTLVGDENAEGVNALTGANGGVVKCPNSTVTGHKTLTTAETASKSHELIPVPSSSATLTAHYGTCTTTLAGANHRTTVTMNGCDYDLIILGTIGETGTYNVEASLVCPEGKDVVLDVYPFAGSELGGVACSITIQAQGGLTGPALSNGPGEHLTLKGTFNGIKSSQSGFGCETEESTTDKLDVDYTITGKNAEGNPTPVTVSH